VGLLVRDVQRMRVVLAEYPILPALPPCPDLRLELQDLVVEPELTLKVAELKGEVRSGKWMVVLGLVVAMVF